MGPSVLLSRLNIRNLPNTLHHNASLTAAALKGFPNRTCSFRGESLFRRSRESGSCHLDLAGSESLVVGH